jgi:hypothetical protein
MVHEFVASAIEALLGLELGATGPATTNGLAIDGITSSPQADGTLVVGVRSISVTSLRVSSGPLALEVGRLDLRQVVAHARIEEGRARVVSVEAAEAELSELKVRGPMTFPPEPRRRLRASDVKGRPAPAGANAAGQAAAGAWCLGPLATAEGTLRAEIVDAHLLFDADVTVPIRHGQIDFNETTVEHVGPDSSMGVSRLGLYVDAPNGRSYVYQFSSVPVAGVEFEQRSVSLGSWVTDRGKLRLQPFGEGLLLQGAGGPGLGFTEQARLLFDRTAVSGDVQLSDGKFTAPGVEADLTGSADGRNAIRLKSGAVGRGLTLEMASLSVQNAVMNWRGTRVSCDEITLAPVFRVQMAGEQLRFACDVANMKITGLRLHPHRPTGRE